MRLRMCLARTGNVGCDRARAEALIVRLSCRLCALGCCAALLRLGYALRWGAVRLFFCIAIVWYFQLWRNFMCAVYVLLWARLAR